MEYYLMHKDDKVAILDIDTEQGALLGISTISKELLPIAAQNKPLNDLSPVKSWWQNRAVSKNQSNIKELLLRYGIASTQKLLLDNLALSFSDTYWVCPKGVPLRWQDVSLFRSFYDGDIASQLETRNGGLQKDADIEKLTGTFSPVASTGGELEKRWKKIGGRIYLLKGNMPGNSFQQSLNEVFASHIHKKQGFKNHVDYTLVKLGKNTTWCKCECFTSEDVELVPAWELLMKHKRPNNVSEYDHYISCMAQEGINEKDARVFLDYQTIVDFLMTNVDRHLNNFGVLRDSNTLRILRPAPIYDTGNSMLYCNYLDSTPMDFLSLEVRSLCKTESDMISKVLDFGTIKLDLLPSSEEIKRFYSIDESIRFNVERIAGVFEYKSNLVRLLATGIPYKTIQNGIKGLVGRDEKLNTVFAINSIASENGLESLMKKLDDIAKTTKTQNRTRSKKNDRHLGH